MFTLSKLNELMAKNYERSIDTGKKDFKKIVRVGKKRIDMFNRKDEKTYINANVYCEIEFKNKRLSIHGVIGPHQGGDCSGSCGQIVDELKEGIMLNPEWGSFKVLNQFIEIWNEWHLNDLTAGSPDQELWIKEHKKEIADDLSFINCGSKDISHYEYVSQRLKEVGLNPDKNYIYEGKPYIYGHAWIFREVPKEVLVFLKCLPNTDIAPAWV